MPKVLNFPELIYRTSLLLNFPFLYFAARLSEKLQQFRESLKGFIYDQISRMFETFFCREFKDERRVVSHKSIVVAIDDYVRKPLYEKKFSLWEEEFKVRWLPLSLFLLNIFTRNLIWEILQTPPYSVSTPFHIIM